MSISVFLLLILTSCVTSDDAAMTSRRLNRRKFLELQRASEQHARRERLRYTTCTSAEEQPQHQLHDNHDASKRKRRSVALDNDVMRRSDDVSILFTEEAGIVEYDLSRLTSRLPAKNLTVEVWVKAPASVRKLSFIGSGTWPFRITKSAHLPGVMEPISSFHGVMSAPAWV